MREDLKYQTLKNELELIQDLAIRDWVVRTLKKVPPYFWKAPASMTGKYHPACSLGRAGLIIHTKRTVYLAKNICLAWKIFNQDRDIVLASSILHDTAKPAPGQTYELHMNHPINAIKYFAEGEDYFIDGIKNCVQWHMGRFSPRSIVKPMKDYTLSELAIYTADYLSSLKDLVTPRDMDTHETVEGGINGK